MATYIRKDRHLTLTQLKKKKKITNDYLPKISPEDKYSVPDYPRPEIHATHLSHSTDLTGLDGIRSDAGFRDPNDKGLVWFSLTVTPDDLRDAETRTMKIVHPGGVEEEVSVEEVEEGLLTQFASSPAFVSSSRYGSYRLTFDLKDVLDRYSEQFCAGRAPVMRTWKTELYPQEVMYAVLVHRPSDERFSQHPLLEEHEHSICAFRDGAKPHFLWRPQAMSATHSFELVRDDLLRASEVEWPQFYVWDHVVLALVVDDQVLRFTEKNVRRSLRFCEEAGVKVNSSKEFQFYDQPKRTVDGATVQVEKLWPGSGNLEKFNQSEFHINNEKDVICPFFAMK